MAVGLSQSANVGMKMNRLMIEIDGRWLAVDRIESLQIWPNRGSPNATLCVTMASGDTHRLFEGYPLTTLQDELKRLQRRLAEIAKAHGGAP